MGIQALITVSHADDAAAAAAAEPGMMMVKSSGRNKWSFSSLGAHNLPRHGYDQTDVTYIDRNFFTISNFWPTVS